jgi:predicted transcriptional regulator
VNKPGYKITNWAKYNESLVRRGDITMWFDEVLDHFEHSHDNTYPIVTDTNELIGIIRYLDVRDVIFEPTAKMLVTAADLAVPVKKVLKQTESLAEAWRMLKDGRDDCVPVVTSEVPHQYVGVVRRRDLLRLLSHDAVREQADG